MKEFCFEEFQSVGKMPAAAEIEVNDQGLIRLQDLT